MLLQDRKAPWKFIEQPDNVDRAGPQEYGRFSQHVALLRDTRRVSLFRRALQSVSARDTVVDVGSGSGILALIALKSGAKNAVLIEPSHKMVEYSKWLMKENGLIDRCQFVNEPLETVDTCIFDFESVVVVSETISSLIIGFGLWDAFPDFCKKLNPVHVIPSSGRLYACPIQREDAVRLSGHYDLGYLRSIGVSIDLDQRTFFSGGNVFEKDYVNQKIQSNEWHSYPILSFDLSGQSNASSSEHNMLVMENSFKCSAVILYWKIILGLDAEGKDIEICSTDRLLTSWNPLVVLLSEEVLMRKGDRFPIGIKCIPVDAPYKYAIQITTDDLAVSNALYW